MNKTNEIGMNNFDTNDTNFNFLHRSDGMPTRLGAPGNLPASGRPVQTGVHTRRLFKKYQFNASI